MPEIIRDPYTGKKFTDTDPAVILSDLKKGIVEEDYYIVSLAPGKNDQLELIRSDMLKNRWVREFVPLVAGIAKDRDEAVLMVCDILEDTFMNTGGYDMRSFLLSKK